MTQTEVIAATRGSLKEAGGTIPAMFTDAEIILRISQTLREIQDREPKLKRACLAVIDNTRAVDISPLTFLKLLRVYYPVRNGGYRGIARKFEQYGTEIELDLSSKPPITSGVLTGTFTFTSGSRTVTATGGALLTQITPGDSGHLICPSAGSQWYQVAYVTDNNTLTLAQPYEGTTVTDTVNLTKYRDYLSCVKVRYGAAYTVSTTSDLPGHRDPILLLGVFAHCLKEYLGAKLTTDDLQADIDLTSARGKVATNNPGGDEAGKYATIAQVGTARGASVSLRNLALQTWQEYQDALNTLGYPEDRNEPVYVRTL